MDMQTFKGYLPALLKPLLEAMVDYPEKLTIEVNASTHVFVISIGSDNADRGKLIGRAGKNAQALRTIVHAICSRYQFRSVVEIIE